MTTDEESREAIRAALIAWRADGVARPIIPVYADLDGDSVPDFFGLDDNDDLVIVPGATIEESVSVSDGSSIEAGRDDPT